MALKQQLKLTVYLSIPAIMTQLSSIVMQYVDASMVGSLGSKCIGFYRTGINNDMVVLGIVCSSCNRLLRASGTSYRSWKFCGARKILRQSITATLLFGSSLAAIGVFISDSLPGWLGGDEIIRKRFICLFSDFFSLFYRYYK